MSLDNFQIEGRRNIMNIKNRCKGRRGFGGNKHKRGPSSFSMQDPKLIFDKLELKCGEVFLDMGCGAGDYTIHAAKILGNSGVVYALDLWEELIRNLLEEADNNKLKNIKAIVTDITDKLPIEDNSVDICFIATVLHSIDLGNIKENLFNEVYRVLKPRGRLAIIECKKDDKGSGPPIQMRLSPAEIEALVLPWNFQKIDLLDLGYNYMIQFEAK